MEPRAGGDHLTTTRWLLAQIFLVDAQIADIELPVSLATQRAKDMQDQPRAERSVVPGPFRHLAVKTNYVTFVT